jgi:hypothetical protein
MLEIGTGIFIGLEINGVEYPLEKNVFQKAVLVSNKRMSVPTCEITFGDLTNRINTEVTLADGVPLIIHIGRDRNDYDSYYYRVYNYKRDMAGSMSVYTIVGYVDSPAWFLQAWKKPIEGTSSKVLETMLSTCGLKSDCDPTNDDMLWLPGNERTCMFARSIAERGYLDDKSCLSLGMTLDGTFKYKNLTTLPTTGPTFTVGSIENTVNVISSKYLISSGYGNSIGGYKHLVRPQVIREFKDKIDQLSVKRKTQTLQLNDEIRGMLQKGRIDFGDIDAGNVHKNWDKARYQNLRTAMIYSMGVELMIDQRTPINLDLFSPFLYEAYDPPATGAAKLTEQYRCVYYITAKVIYLEGGNYFEKFQGYTTGINKDPDGKGSQT